MKPRVIVSVILIGACCFGGWYLYRQATEDPGLPISLAFGNLNEGEVELHVVVSIGMVATEGLRALVLSDGAPSRQTWDEWIAEHFDLHDDSGQRVQLRRDGHSSLISDQQAHNPEFYLVGKLLVGVNYTFDYIPRRDWNIHHRQRFTAPAEDRPFQRLYFETVYVN